LTTKLIVFLQRINGWRLWLLTVLVCVILAECIAIPLRLMLTGEMPGFVILIVAVVSIIVASLVSASLTYFLNTLSEIREHALQKSALRAESRLSMALEATSLIFWEYDFIHDRLHYEDEMLKLLDMDITDPPHSLQAWLARVHPDDAPAFVTQFQQAMDPAGDSCFDIEYRLAQCQRPWGWVHTKGCVVQRDAKGQALLAVGTSLEISPRKQAEAEIREAKERFELIFKFNPDGMVISRLPDGIITDVNDAFCSASGLSKSESIGNTTLGLNLWTHADDRQKMTEQLRTTGVCTKFEAEFSLKDGSIRTGLLSAVITHLHGVPHIVSTIQDITEKKKFDNQIWHQANFDTLTQLPNRRMFDDRLTQDLKKAHRAGLQLALLFLDLDHFKEVNDTLGHDMGDELLIEAARRITSCVRASDTVARLGGDEFTVILAELEETHIVHRIAENIIHTLTMPYHLGAEVVRVSASIGITLYPDDATELAELTKNADQAMYVAKQAGRNRYSYFTPAAQQAAQHRQQSIAELRTAVATGQFRLFYQPIFELRTGRICKADALMRWQHPKRGILSPSEFIPAAEELGLTHEISAWLFLEAARQLSQWQSFCEEDFQICIKLSFSQFQSSDHRKDWQQALQTTGVNGRNMMFSIDQRVWQNSDNQIAAQLQSCRNAGIQLATEDFGSDYSTLTHLKDFDIDYLNIPTSFVSELTAKSSELALSTSIIQMAHERGMKVIAQGVETSEQRDLLSAAGCDYVQGYLYSRPLPPDAFELILKENMHSVVSV